jgi:hypothetical protein
MKKIFLLLFVLLSFASFGQLSGTILTTSREISIMKWSDLDNKFVFITQVPRLRSNWRWIVEINSSKVGFIEAEDLDKGEWYRFNVYDWELIHVEGTSTAVMIKSVQQNGGQKVEIIVAKYESGNQTISVFIKEDELSVYFDNFPQK